MSLLPEERNPHINYGATAGSGQSSMDVGKQGAKRQCAGTPLRLRLRLPTNFLTNSRRHFHQKMQKDQSCKKLRLLVALMMPLDEIYLGNKLFLNNCNFSPDEEGHDYDSALELAGYGGFHYWLAFICGWANASDAVEILCISFLLPSAGLTNKKFP